MSIKVLIADDYPILRWGLVAYLDGQPDICVVGEAEDGDQVLPEVERSCPEVLLLDVNMPGMAAGQILEALPDLENPPTVLIFSAYSDPDKVVGLVRGGVQGYLLKNIPPGQIVEGIRAVAGEKACFSPAIAEVLAKELRGEGSSINIGSLSKRELQVLQLMAQGYRNGQIADTLSITERTVRYHTGRIIDKLKVNNRFEAVVEGLRQSWISIR